MAENDIYNSQKRYKDFVSNLNIYVLKPEGKRKYQIKNEANLKYYEILVKKFEARDSSYIRRLRLLRSFLIVTNIITKDLKEATREDLDKVMAYFNKQKFSPKTKKDFVIDVKFIWKQILPEKDKKGRPDETEVPYVVKHLSPKVDKSTEKRRNDKLTIEEFESLVSAFGNDVRMKALLTLAIESLVRPQELLYTKIKDVELYDNYAKIYVSEHGKEGIKFLRCIDSFFYVSQWYNQHPQKKNPDAFFFITMGNKSKYKQLIPSAVNKQISLKCKLAGINKPITFYSLKRNGVTIRRLRGDSDLEIQHTAGWTSTKQLRTYDMSEADESFTIELIKRGLVKPDKKYKEFQPLNKKCLFCGFDNGIAESQCKNCKRPLDRGVIEKEAKDKDKEVKELRERLDRMPEYIEQLINDKAEALLKVEPGNIQKAIKIKNAKHK